MVYGSLTMYINMKYLSNNEKLNYRQSFLKDGTLIGTDGHGNKYYENKEFAIGEFFNYTY